MQKCFACSVLIDVAKSGLRPLGRMKSQCCRIHLGCLDRQGAAISWLPAANTTIGSKRSAVQRLLSAMVSSHGFAHHRIAVIRARMFKPKL